LPGLKDEDYNKILSAAAQEIEAERQTRVQQYVNQGLTYQRALARTDRELTSVPDLFETAAAVSIVKGVQKGLYSITPKAAGKVKGKVGIAPIPTPPPIIAGAGGGGSDNVDTSPRIKATAYEVEVAKSMGIDPHKLALVRAQREGRA
jgi:hypothetical protein